MFLVSAENGVGVNKNTNITYAHCAVHNVHTVNRILLLNVCGPLQQLRSFIGFWEQQCTLGIKYNRLDHNRRSENMSAVIFAEIIGVGQMISHIFYPSSNILWVSQTIVWVGFTQR